MVGRRYGMLEVVEELATDKAGKRFLCKCDCGNLKVARKHHLLQGRLKSCGCMREKHGCTKSGVRTREFTIWVTMRQRCSNPKTANYRDYGGRGISVDPRWEDFSNFIKDMGEAPEGYTLDRIDPNGNYEPSNCRWATLSQQQRNRRDTVFYTIDGRTETFMGWANLMGLKPSSLCTLLLKHSMTDIWGMHNRGEIKAKPRKLTKDTAVAVFLEDGRPIDIATKYNIDSSTVVHIKKGRSWKSAIKEYMDTNVS